MAGGDNPRPFTDVMAIKKSLNCINIVPPETRTESGESRIIVVNDEEIENVFRLLVSNVWRIKWNIEGGNSFTFYVDIFYN